MLSAQLVRFHTDIQGTSGILKLGAFTCYTLELPWYNNISNFSCIPEGTYRVVYTKSPRMKKFTYELLKVPKRSGIRIHGANYAGDSRKGYKTHLHGCIALGNKFYGTGKVPPISNQRMLGASQAAVQAFESYTKKQSFMLHISWLDNVKGD